MLKAQIVGNVGSDPELRYSTSGSSVLIYVMGLLGVSSWRA